MSTAIDKVTVRPGTSIRETLRRIDDSSMQIALVVDEDRRLMGVVTDGDVRRGILQGVSLDAAASCIMNPHPTVATLQDDRDQILTSMRQKQIHHMPVVDEQGRLVGLELLDELVVPPVRDNLVLLMAGGLGSRLRPLTDDLPKPMLRIGSRPILETILLNFLGYGFRRFRFALNHRAEVIMEHFGDGSRWQAQIQYICETQQLGTAGALGLLPDKPASPIVVMNGDVLTKVNFGHLLDFHVQQGSKGTMCVREYEVQVPYGVIRVNGEQILAIEEKPKQRFLVNAGIYVLDPEVIQIVPQGSFLDMTALFDMLVQHGMPTAVFPLREYWMDVGQPADLLQANSDFEQVFK